MVIPQIPILFRQIAMGGNHRTPAFFQEPNLLAEAACRATIGAFVTAEVAP
jgi:hypothetical protein